MSKRVRDRRELGFFDHLDELRARIIRAVVYVTVGGVLGWTQREWLLAVLRRPADLGAKAVGIEHLPFRVFEPAEGFMIAIQVALVAGLVLAAPLIFWEIWRFIEPALEDHERRYVVLILPAAVVLFLGGIAFCYAVSPRAFAFLFAIDQTLGVDVERTLRPYLWFIIRLMLGFGLAFELPMVLMFLGFIGVVTSRQLVSWWRYAVVIIFAFSAIITPTVDPVNMTILALPMILLYALSVGLVHMVQRNKERAEARAEAEWAQAEAQVAERERDEAAEAEAREEQDDAFPGEEQGRSDPVAAEPVTDTDVGEGHREADYSIPPPADEAVSEDASDDTEPQSGPGIEETDEG